MTKAGDYSCDVYYDENGKAECAWIAEMRNPWAPEPHCYGPEATFWGEDAEKFDKELDGVFEEARKAKDDSITQKFLEKKWRGV